MAACDPRREEVAGYDGMSFLTPVIVIYCHPGHKCKHDGKRSLEACARTHIHLTQSHAHLHEGAIHEQQ